MSVTQFLIPPNLIHLRSPSNNRPNKGENGKQDNLPRRDITRSTAFGRYVNINPPHFCLSPKAIVYIDEPDISPLCGVVVLDSTACGQVG
jgi:hypothetical protein